jgi:glycosyltransferase involved in cell wall biosynthesis
MTVAIAAGNTCVKTENGSYIAPIHSKSLAQWVRLFRDVRLIIPQSSAKSPPDGWEKVPDKIKVCGLDTLNKSHFARRRAVFSAMKEYLDGVELLYARMPDYIIYWVFCDATKRKIPVLLELHGDWETSIMVSEINGSLVRLATRRFRAYLAHKATQKMADYACAAVTIGPALAEKYVNGEKPLLISTNHTVEEKQYHQRQEHNLKTPPCLLFVGELAERKGLRCLFAAIRRLKNLGYKFEISLVGDGPLKNYLKTYSEKYGLDQYVNFVEHLSFGPKLLEYYKQADVFVLPSIAGEGVPRVVHEAMSQGCPVIATDVGSIKWQLEAGAGIVIPPADTEALTQNIIRILEDERLRKNLSIKGFARSMEFTYEKQAEKVAAFVRKCVPSELLA